MKNFIAKLKKHHQIEVEKMTAKIVIVFRRSIDGSIGIDYYQSYEEITEQELQYYIKECDEIRIAERE